MISIRTLKTILLLAFVLAFASTATAQMQSDNYRIPSSALSGGGGGMDSGSYQMTTTTGQSSATGISSSTNYINSGGFWHPTELKVKGKVKAMPWIPLLLLDD